MVDTKLDKKDSEEVDLISGKIGSMPQKEMKKQPMKIIHHKKHKKMNSKPEQKPSLPNKPKHKKHRKKSKTSMPSKINLKKSKPVQRINHKDFPSLNINKDTGIAMDFATKTYERFNKLVKSVVLFGSSTKQTAVQGSDIDIIVIIDDVAINWDQELIAWYREELDKIVRRNPYKKSLHINTIKLSTWWDDLLRGDPMIINVIRYGESLIDFGGFFEPLKFLLLKGKIRSTPEAVYSCLQRAPQHFLRSKTSELNAIEGLYWAMVDSSHAALISRNILPPSPEHIPLNLKETFVAEKSLDMKFVMWYRDLLFLYKKISHGEISDLKGVEIDMWQERTNEFMRAMAKLVDESITGNKINFDLEPQKDGSEEKRE